MENELFFIFFVIVSYYIYVYSFKRGMPTCNNYVTNNYLYLTLSILYIYIIVYNFPTYIHYSWTAFFIGLVLLTAMMFLFPKDKTSVFINHVLWISFLTCISFMLLPIVYFYDRTMIIQSLLSVASIFLFMSLIVYLYPEVFKNTINFMYPALFISLILIILIEVYYLFIISNYPKKDYRYISYFVIIVFSLYISYDTYAMLEEAKYCVKYANYPKSSLKFLLDLVNLFVRHLTLTNS